jgi:hypothetical protein
MLYETLPDTAGAATSASILPEDLGEWHGAVRLTHHALEAVQAATAAAELTAGDRAWLTLYVYALARGVCAAEDLERQWAQDACLRYLGGALPPEASQLRAFRRRHAPLLVSALAFLISRSLGQLDALPKLGFDPRAEAARRFNRAVVADSLALDF